MWFLPSCPPFSFFFGKNKMPTVLARIYIPVLAFSLIPVQEALY